MTCIVEVKNQLTFFKRPLIKSITTQADKVHVTLYLDKLFLNVTSTSISRYSKYFILFRCSKMNVRVCYMLYQPLAFHLP